VDIGGGWGQAGGRRGRTEWWEGGRRGGLPSCGASVRGRFAAAEKADAMAEPVPRPRPRPIVLARGGIVKTGSRLAGESASWSIPEQPSCCK
jgi:hypothetical protein